MCTKKTYPPWSEFIAIVRDAGVTDPQAYQEIRKKSHPEWPSNPCRGYPFDYDYSELYGKPHPSYTSISWKK